jgi:hypothetical protein
MGSWTLIYIVNIKEWECLFDGIQAYDYTATEPVSTTYQYDESGVLLSMKTALALQRLNMNIQLIY